MPSAKKPRLSRKQKEDAAEAADAEAAQPQDAILIYNKQGSHCSMEFGDLESRKVKLYLDETIPSGQYCFEKTVNEGDITISCSLDVR